jgi:thiol:disulfide interchange protein
MKRIAFVFLTLITLVGFDRTSDAGPVRLEKKLGQDSTILTLKIADAKKIKAGGTFEVRIHANFHAPWHIYSSAMSADGGLVPLTVALPEAIAPYFKIQSLKETGTTTNLFDSNFQTLTMAHYSPYDIIATVKVLKHAADKVPFSLIVHYQTCNESQCLQPRSFEVPMTVLGQKPIDVLIAEGTDDTTTTAGPAIASKDTAGSRVSNATGVGKVDTAAANAGTIKSPKQEQAFSWYYLLVAVVAGLGALVTPCVYPMIPITVSFFTKRNAGSRMEAVKDALLYGFGIILTFVILGFLLNLIFSGGIQGFAANPITNIAVAVVFILFALNLFGLFEIGVPSALLSKLNSTAQSSKNRVASVMLMGFVFSLTSFTCSVPFVGSAFGAFKHGSYLTPIIGLTVFGTIFALPFVVLALVPSMVKQMPRSGGWLNSVKVVMGFLEVAVAIRYFSNADLILHWEFFSRDLVIASWVAIAIITTLYLLGRFQLSHDTPVEHIGALRVMLSVLVLSVGVYLYTGLHGRALGQIDAFLPPESEQQASLIGTGASLSGALPAAQRLWHERFDTALAEAKRTGKNVFIDFTGYTCTNCRAMEATVFSRKDIQDIFSNFVLARLYTDNGSALNDSNRDMEESRFNTSALPYYVIVSPNDEALATFPGFTRDVEAFKSFLRLERKPSEPRVAMNGQ